MTGGRGESLQNTVDAAGVIGAHYRRWMSPLYVAYRWYHGGGVAQLDADNQWVQRLHQRGAQMGYKLCSRVRP